MSYVCYFSIDVRIFYERWESFYYIVKLFTQIRHMKKKSYSNYKNQMFRNSTQYLVMEILHLI